MSKVHHRPIAATPRPRVALLSNPQSAAGVAQLPRVRAYCADHPDVFHYEVEHAGQVGEAMQSIARMRPAVLAINGDRGTLEAALAELGRFSGAPPAVEVIEGGRVESLQRLVALARGEGSSG
ncbi:MAG: hypothetical protein ACJ8FT_02495 [Sphingomonas sp.]